MTRMVWKASVVVLVTAVLLGCAGSPQERRNKYLSRGKDLIQKKDYTRALLEFKNAAKVIPNDAEVYYEIGLALLGLQDFRSSYAAFQKALSLDPKHAAPQLKIAHLQIQPNNPNLLKNSPPIL